MNLLKIKPQLVLDFISLKISKRKDFSLHESAHAAADWLLRSQEIANDGGYAHSYHFLYGWQKSYPETTGYIIPSLIEWGEVSQDLRYKNSALKALEYLNKTQEEDGSFCDLNGKKQVFDAGQILIGHNCAKEKKLEGYDEKRHHLLCKWLIAQQNSEGAFIGNTFRGLAHSYYSRVGAALLHAGTLLNNEVYKDAGLKNIYWTIAQQQGNGFFLHSSFEGMHHPALSHTLVYTLEGLWDAYLLTLDAKIYSSFVKGFDALWATALKTQGVLFAKYDSTFNCTDNSICTTGLSQWIAVCIRYAVHTKKNEYLEFVPQLLKKLKQNQLFGSKNFYGGLPGSIPMTGKYMKLSIPNWGQKFYLDAVICNLTVGVGEKYET